MTIRTGNNRDCFPSSAMTDSGRHYRQRSDEAIPELKTSLNLCRPVLRLLHNPGDEMGKAGEKIPDGTKGRQ